MQIGKLVQKKIDKILERAAKGKLKTRMVVMLVQTLTVKPYSSSDHQPLQNYSFRTLVNLPKWHHVSAIPNSHTIPPHSTAI